MESQPAAAGGDDSPGKNNADRNPKRKPSEPDESKNKPKLRDRLTSFRKSGVKKEKPLIQHPTESLSAVTEFPVPVPEESKMNLSEKEIKDLFEKMMEDMNLNEERKAPLRQKDLARKHEMVVQYISATAKSITGSKAMGNKPSRLRGGILITLLILEMYVVKVIFDHK